MGATVHYYDVKEGIGTPKHVIAIYVCNGFGRTMGGVI